MTPDTEHNPNAFQNSDFDDLSLFAGVQQEAEEARDRQQERENRAPVSYPDEGSYWLRFYPEIRVEEDGSRRLHVVRKFWSYTGLAKGVRRLPAPKDPNCPIRAEVQRLIDAKHPEAWKYRASEEGLIKVCIFQSSLPKDHKYIKLNVPMYLVLRRKQVQALNEFLADLSPEDLRKILDPRTASTRIKFSYTKGSGGSASFGFDIKEAALPDLPPEFPSMFDVLINDETPPATDEEIQKVRKSISAILLSSSNVLNPDEDGSGAPVPTRNEQQRQAAAAGAVGDILKGAAKGSKAGKTDAEAAPVVNKDIPVTVTCPSDDPALSFGHHNGDHVDCITCPHEAECSKESTIPY